MSRTIQARHLDSAHAERELSLLSLSLSLGGVVRDDPRVVSALEEYLEALTAGRTISLTDFLAQHSEIADALRQSLSGLEFIHAAGIQIRRSQTSSSRQPSDLIAPSAQLGDYRILREVGRGDKWCRVRGRASFVRPACRPQSAPVRCSHRSQTTPAISDRGPESCGAIPAPPSYCALSSASAVTMKSTTMPCEVCRRSQSKYDAP